MTTVAAGHDLIIGTENHNTRTGRTTISFACPVTNCLIGQVAGRPAASIRGLVQDMAEHHRRIHTELMVVGDDMLWFEVPNGQ